MGNEVTQSLSECSCDLCYFRSHGEKSWYLHGRSTYGLPSGRFSVDIYGVPVFNWRGWVTPTGKSFKEMEQGLIEDARIRAYYLWKSGNEDTLSNWLEAERFVMNPIGNKHGN